MALPLYQSACEALPVHDPKKPSGNCGLWFERFYDRYRPDFLETKDSDSAFKEWLQCFEHLAGDNDLLDVAIQRQSLLVESLGGVSALFKSDWHFVTGMGNPHPLENGFNWHPVLGVPYLSGSGVKGLVRAWVESWIYEAGDPKEEKSQRLLDWFGSEGKSPEDRSETGKLIFFDAIPYKPVRLTTDIMTPHMGQWYAEGESINRVQSSPDAIPADWHSPTPIYFLAAKEPVFLFSIALRSELFADEVDLDEVAQCLADALEWLGAGAKTAVGYGDFYRDDKATESLKRDIEATRKALMVEAEQTAQRQGLSGIALELMQHIQQENWEVDKTSFTKPGEKSIEKWLERIEETPDDGAILLMYELVDKHFSGLFLNPDKTTGKKKKPVFNQRQRDFAAKLQALKSSEDSF